MSAGAGSVARADTMEVPGGTAAMARLLGHVDTAPDRFAASLNRALLRRIPADLDGPLAADRRRTLAYLDAVTRLRAVLGPLRELTLTASGEYPAAFVELASFFGYAPSEGGWTAPVAGDAAAELKLQVATALDLDVGAIAYRLERGERVRIEIPVEFVEAPLPFDRWTALTGRAVDAATALHALIVDPRLSLWLEGQRRADPRLVDWLGADPARRLYADGSLTFFRFGASRRLEGDRLALPGGPGSTEVWRSWVGAAPDEPRAFLLALIQDEKSRAAHLWHALAFAPPPVRQAVLADDREGAGLRETLAAYVDRILAAQGAGLLSVGTGGDHGVSTLLRSLPIGQGTDSLAAAWLDRRAFDRACVDEERILKIARRLKGKVPSEARFLDRLLSDPTPLDGRLGLLFQPYMEVRDLARVSSDLLTPINVILLRRIAGYRRLALQSARDLPLSDAETLTELLFAVERLDCLVPESHRDAVSLGFQAGLELTAGLVRGGGLSVERGAWHLDGWLALHRGIGSDGAGVEQVAERLAWLVAVAGDLPEAGIDAPGRGPLERRLLAALAGPDPHPTFRAQGMDYVARRGRDVAATMVAYLRSQTVTSVDRLIALADELEAAERAWARRDRPELRLAVRRIGGLIESLEIPAEARVAGLERPEFARAIRHRQVLADMIDRHGSHPQRVGEGVAERTLAAARELIEREWLGSSSAFAYLRPVALLGDARFDQPLFVMRHTVARGVDPQGAALEIFPTAWSETTVVPAAFAPAGSHLAGSLVHVPRALTQHHALSLAPQRPAHTWVDVRPWWTAALETDWTRLSGATLRRAEALLAAGDTVIETVASDPDGVAAGLRDAVQALVPSRRFHDARVAGDARPRVGAGARLQAGLALWEHDHPGAALRDARRKLAVALPPGDGAAALDGLGVATPRLNGAFSPRIGGWPPYEALEREASVAALRERMFVDLWWTLVGWLTARDLPARVGYDVFLRILEDVPERVRLETERDWEAWLRFLDGIDAAYLEGRLRACLMRGLYSAASP